MRSRTTLARQFVSALAAGLVISACSKQGPQTAGDRTTPKPETGKNIETARTVEAPVTNVTAAGSPSPTAGSSGASDAETAMEVAELEKEYVSNTAFTARVELIYKISDADIPEAVAALGRCFHLESDPNLRIKVLDSLSDVDGFDDQKAAILAAGVSADQPQEVRESAIDGLTDIEPKKALPILQALLNDPDEDIREAANDAIESVQDSMNSPQAAPGP